VTRLGTQIGQTLFAGMRGRIPRTAVASALASDVADFAAAYKGYITNFASTWKNDEILSYHRENLNAVDNLREDFNRQMEIYRNGTPKQKAVAVLKAA